MELHPSRSYGLLLLAVAALSFYSQGCSRPSDATPATADSKPAAIEILNVSYDPTRELYKEFNQAFAEHWAAQTGQTVSVRMTHGGSGKQAVAVTQGVEAAVVTLALAYDVDIVPAGGPDRRRLARSARQPQCPVHLDHRVSGAQGNPKHIKDWDDLVKGDVAVITPHPKTSGGARWNYLAAWGYALKRELGDLTKLHDPSQADAVAKAQEKARQFVAELYRHVPILDTGAEVRQSRSSRTARATCFWRGRMKRFYRSMSWGAANWN